MFLHKARKPKNTVMHSNCAGRDHITMNSDQIDARQQQDEFDPEFITAESLLKVVVDTLMQEHHLDRAAAKYWLRIAGKVVFEDD